MDEHRTSSDGDGNGAAGGEPQVGIPLSLAFAVFDDWLQSGRVGAAETLLAAIDAAAPDSGPRALRHVALASLRKQPRLALRLAQAAIAAGGKEHGLFRALYDMQIALGDDRGVLATAERGTAAAPDNPDAWTWLADARYRNDDPEGAIEACRTALGLDAKSLGAHSVLAEALLVLGRYEEGWEEYLWRFRRPHVLQLRVTPDGWEGARRADWPHRDARLMVYGDQGMGDVIQFIRYLPFIAERCAGEHIVLVCAQQLHPLLRPYLDRVAPGAELVPLGAPTPGVAMMVPLSAVPRLAGTRLDTIPGPSPYLHADPAAAAAWRARLDARLPPGRHLRVGLIWSGNPQQGNNPIRAMPLAHLAPLTEIDGIALVALQKGEAAEAQLAAYSGRAPLISIGPELNDFADTAACLAGLDLLVATDTGPVHLAGAMGVPTFLMLARGADWRWLRGRSDSPWYPSLRLFRQPASGEWPAVVAAVAEAVTALVAGASSKVASSPRNGA